MARKKPTTRAAQARRKRRTPEEIIADLQRRIEAVKARAKARELADSPAVKSALSAVKALDRAARAADEERDRALQHALFDARTALFDELTGRGVELAKARRPKGRRPA